MAGFVLVALLGPGGRLLMHERGPDMRGAPGAWALPGGAVESGESPRAAAVREVRDETGLRVAPDDLEDLGEFHVDVRRPLDVRVFAATTSATDDDVVCGEGQAMVFGDLDDLADLALATPTRDVLPVVAGWRRERAGEGSHRFAGVLLVDRRGRLLLQERDEHPRIDPEKWGLCGGHLDPGEDFETAAHRELAEETGVVLPPGVLSLWREFSVDHTHVYGTFDRMQVFVAGCDLTDADIDCHEGRRIVFVDPGLARTLDLTAAAAQILPAFLDSAVCRRLLPPA